MYHPTSRYLSPHLEVIPWLTLRYFVCVRPELYEPRIQIGFVFSNSVDPDSYSVCGSGSGSTQLKIGKKTGRTDKNSPYFLHVPLFSYSLKDYMYSKEQIRKIIFSKLTMYLWESSDPDLNPNLSVFYHSWSFTIFQCFHKKAHHSKSPCKISQNFAKISSRNFSTVSWKNYTR